MALLLFMFILVFVPLVIIGGLIDGLETLVKKSDRILLLFSLKNIEK